MDELTGWPTFIQAQCSFKQRLSFACFATPVPHYRLPSNEFRFIAYPIFRHAKRKLRPPAGTAALNNYKRQISFNAKTGDALFKSDLVPSE